MDWTKFNYDEFSKRTLGKIGLLTSIIDEEAEECKQSYRNGDEVIDSTAKYTVPFIPAHDKILVMGVFYTSPSTIKAIESMAKEPFVFNMIVGYGAMNKNYQIGDIIEVSQHVTKHKVTINENSLSASKLNSFYNNPLIKSTAKDDFTHVYVVEYYTIPIHGVEGLYEI